MFKKIFLVFVLALFASFSICSGAWAGADWWVPDADNLNGYADDDVEIESNRDDGADGHITIYDSGHTVFEASQGTTVEGGSDEYTDITSNDSIYLEIDEDNESDGTLYVQNGTNQNLMIVNNNGDVTLGLAADDLTTVSGDLTVNDDTTLNGIDNNSGGITETGAVAGVTTLGASGLGNIRRWYNS
jgi:hypothetical protein